MDGTDSVLNKRNFMSSDYFLPSNVKSFLGNEYIDSLKCFHLNARSARNKTDELELFFDQFEFSFDIIMLSETWFTDNTNVLNLPMYNSYFLNRTECRGGGVALIVKADISCEMLSDYCCVHNDYEMLSLLIGESIIAVCYRPPSGNLSSFFAYLESFFEFANENKCNVILGGDFNVNMLLDTTCKLQFDALIKSNGCENMINTATRITTESSTLLDLFITSYDTSYIKSGVVIVDISDHLGIFLCIKKNQTINIKYNDQLAIQFQNITPDSRNEFRQKLSCVDWDDVLHETNADKAYDLFLTKFKKIYESCFPYKKLSTHRKSR